MKNLEIKASFKDLNRLRRTIVSLGGNLVETRRQTDTYFNVPKGRLKLRQTKDRTYLIFYERGEKTTKRWSDYRTYEVQNPNEFKKYFAKVLGVRVVVDKKRSLYMYKNARIHVDEVKDLGNFMEIEVEVKKGNSQAKVLMKELLEYLQIPKRDFIKASYSDLLLDK